MAAQPESENPLDKPLIYCRFFFLTRSGFGGRGCLLLPMIYPHVFVHKGFTAYIREDIIIECLSRFPTVTSTTERGNSVRLRRRESRDTTPESPWARGVLRNPGIKPRPTHMHLKKKKKRIIFTPRPGHAQFNTEEVRSPGDGPAWAGPAWVPRPNARLSVPRPRFLHSVGKSYGFSSIAPAGSFSHKQTPISSNAALPENGFPFVVFACCSSRGDGR